MEKEEAKQVCGKKQNEVGKASVERPSPSMEGSASVLEDQVRVGWGETQPLQRGPNLTILAQERPP